MRIVAGRLRGRRIEAPEGHDVRPTSDRVREALFDILAHGATPLPDGAVVADIFCGTGALGLEAISRGAAHAVFMENDRTALDLARKNAAGLGVAGQTTFLARDARRPGPAPRPADLLFLDAPYQADLTGPALTALIEAGWCRDGAIIVLELAKTEDVALPASCEAYDRRVYGKTKLILARYSAATA
jgi:16S rRNA (guanine966-N2)-methyltransferase